MFPSIPSRAQQKVCKRCEEKFPGPTWYEKAFLPAAAEARILWVAEVQHRLLLCCLLHARQLRQPLVLMDTPAPGTYAELCYAKMLGFRSPFSTGCCVHQGYSLRGEGRVELRNTLSGEQLA